MRCSATGIPAGTVKTTLRRCRGTSGSSRRERCAGELIVIMACCSSSMKRNIIREERENFDSNAISLSCRRKMAFALNRRSSMQQRGVPLSLSKAGRTPVVTMSSRSPFFLALYRHVGCQSRSSHKYRLGLDIPVVPSAQADWLARRAASLPVRTALTREKAGVLRPERRL